MAPHALDKPSSNVADKQSPPNGFIPSASQTPKSDLVQKSALLHRSLIHEPNKVVNASGIYITLSSGEKIIDACGGAAVSALGHGNQEVFAATLEQMQSISYVHTGAYTTDAAEELAHILLDGNPYGLSKAFFVGSGSEAMDAALKLARQYWYETEGAQTKRRNIVARRQGYHGSTIGSMSVSSNLPRKVPYEPLLLPNVSFVSPAYAYQYQRLDEGETEHIARLIDELDVEFQRLGPETVIAFVAETVVGATSACTPAPEGYFRAVREVCDKYKIILILDEVMCGMGRTGMMFAFEHEDVVPDIMTMGKGLGGGYAAIAGMLLSERVVDGLQKGTAMLNHAQTYQAHPLSCATALAVQRIVKRDGLVQRCAQMGEVLEKLLRSELRDCKFVGDIRGRGLFWGIEFVKDRSTKASFDPRIEFGYQVQRKAFELGVAIYPGSATVDGVKGDHVLLAPPYTVTEEELLTIVKVVKKAYCAAEADCGKGEYP